MRKNDIFLIAAILCTAALLFVFFGKGGKRGENVEIYINNALAYTLPLDRDDIIDIDGENQVEIKNGKVFMKSADCPDQICVKQKALSESGRDIICLPNKVLVRVVSGTREHDAVSR